MGLMAIGWLGTKTKQSTAMFFPTKPQLFRFKRSPQLSTDSANANGNGTTTTSTIANGGGAPDLGTTTTKSGLGVDSDSDDVEPISVQTVLETRVPTLFKDFKPSWWLPNGHMQTGYVVAGDFSKVDTIMYER